MVQGGEKNFRGAAAPPAPILPAPMLLRTLRKAKKNKIDPSELRLFIQIQVNLMMAKFAF